MMLLKVLETLSACDYRLVILGPRALGSFVPCMVARASRYFHEALEPNAC